jgi:threonine synthase
MFCNFDKKVEGMNTKLTLTIEQSIIEKAKKYARKRERSLSEIIENYLKALINEEKDVEEDLTPKVKALKGSFKLPQNFDYKKELTDRLSEKYL